MPFEVIITKDGSPTLAPMGHASREAMHNLEGALSESAYCYGDPFREAQAEGADSLLVVGLGLGAIEMLSMVEPPKRILSFEADKELREAFLAWLAGQSFDDWRSGFEQMADAVAAQNELGVEEIRSRLKAMLDTGAFRIAGRLDESNLPDERFDFIAFDAYSEATSPELWSEAFLVSFLDSCATNRAWLSTYAAKGVLKRALKAAGFEVTKRAGFGGKRQSTLAKRLTDSPKM